MGYVVQNQNKTAALLRLWTDKQGLMV